MTVEESLEIIDLPAYVFQTDTEHASMEAIIEAAQCLAAEYNRPHQRLLRMFEAGELEVVAFDSDYKSASWAVQVAGQSHWRDTLDEAALKVLDALEVHNASD